MNQYLDYFDNYVCKGLMPIAIHKGTKVPIAQKWNIGWSARKWRHFFYDGEHELGLLWNGNIVDVEADDENSNAFLNKLIGNIDRPIYKSYRSHHNLFITPYPKLTKVHLYGPRGEKIEIFGKKTFTMAPPSNHVKEGVKYEFINDFWPPPKFPNALKSLYFQQKKIKILNKEKKESICTDCGKDYCLHRKRLKLEVRSFISVGLGWKCIKCRKNYKVDIKEECRKLRKTIEKI
jgi:hypothetical protein